MTTPSSLLPAVTIEGYEHRRYRPGHNKRRRNIPRGNCRRDGRLEQISLDEELDGRDGRMTAPVVLHVRDVAAFERVLELLIEFESSLPERLRHDSKPDVRSIKSAYADPNAAFIASVDGIASGCIAVTRLDEMTAIVQRLYVRPGYRRHGAARMLMAAAIDF